MANRQVVSVNERLAIEQEGAYWNLVHELLMAELYERFPGILFVALVRNDPVLAPSAALFTHDNRTIQLQYSMLADTIKTFSIERLHWVIAYNAPGNKTHALIGTQRPLNKQIDSAMQHAIVGSSSIDEAIDRLLAWKESRAAVQTGWDVELENKPFARPHAWSYVNRIRFAPLTGMEMNSASLAFEPVMQFLKVVGYERIDRDNYLSESQHAWSSQVRELMPQDQLEALWTHMIFAHTAKSMHARGMPMLQGQKQVTANDAPSHATTRFLILLRLRELFPHIHDEARPYLPTTTQRKIAAHIMGAEIAKTFGHAEPEPNPLDTRPHPEVPKSPRLTVRYDPKLFEDLAKGDPIEEF